MNTDAPKSTEVAPGGGEQRPKGWWPFRYILAYTRGLITDQHLRRVTMFYVVIAAMVMFFVGDLFLDEWLDWHRHLSRFLVYWLVCGWLTLLAALLAIYDLLLLRIQHRLMRRALRARILDQEHPRDTED